MTVRHASAGRGGIARHLARSLEIPPELTGHAGTAAIEAMAELKQAVVVGSCPLCDQHVVNAQQHLRKIDPRSHGALLQYLQSIAVALGGRGGDTMLAHVTPGEHVVTDSLMTPEVVEMLQRAAREKGLDPARFVVGSGRNSINPCTGLMEFADPAAPAYPYADDQELIPEVTVTTQSPPIEAENLMQGISDEWNNPYVQNAKTGVIKGLTDIAGTPGNIEHYITGQNGFPTTDELNQWAFSGPPEYVPETRAGKIGQDFVEWGTSGLL